MDQPSAAMEASRASPWARRLAIASGMGSGASAVLGGVFSFYAEFGDEASRASWVALALAAIATVALLEHRRRGGRAATPEQHRVGETFAASTRKVMSRVNTPWLMVPITLLVPCSVPIAILIHQLTGEEASLALFPLSLLLALIAMGFGLVQTRVTLDADAITTSWLGLHRTVALRDVVEVEVTKAGVTRPSYVRLKLRGGATFDIAVGSRGHHLFEPYALEEECAIIVAQIEGALRNASSAPSPTTPAA